MCQQRLKVTISHSQWTLFHQMCQFRLDCCKLVQLLTSHTISSLLLLVIVFPSSCVSCCCFLLFFLSMVFLLLLLLLLSFFFFTSLSLPPIPPLPFPPSPPSLSQVSVLVVGSDYSSPAGDGSTAVVGVAEIEFLIEEREEGNCSDVITCGFEGGGACGWRLGEHTFITVTQTHGQFCV